MSYAQVPLLRTSRRSRPLLLITVVTMVWAVTSLEPTADAMAAPPAIRVPTLAPPTVPVGQGIGSIPISRATGTAYVPNGNDGTVSIVNTATCGARDVSSCAETAPTFAVADGAGAGVVDDATHTLFEAGFNGQLSAIDISACNAHTMAGCATSPAVSEIGLSAVDIAFDSSTGTVYTADLDGSVSVVDGAHCDAVNRSGCGQPQRSVQFGSVEPSGIILDPTSGTLYVANLAETPPGPGEADTVNLINTRTCNGEVGTSCAVTDLSVAVGTANQDNNVAFALDQQSHTLYVANLQDNTISLIDSLHCRASDTTGCALPHPVAPAAGGLTVGLVVDPTTRTLYEVNNGNNTVSVVSSARCNAQNTMGCSSDLGTIRAGVNVSDAALDAATHTLYVANSAGCCPDDVSIVNTATCNANDHVGCSPPPVAAPAGNQPSAIALDRANHTAYVVNRADGTVSMLDTRSCSASTPGTCVAAAPTVTVGANPQDVAVDPATNSVYVANGGDDTVTVLNGSTCSATDLSDCALKTVRVGPSPSRIAVDPAVHTAYVVNSGGSTVSEINTSTCNGDTAVGCSAVPTTASVGTAPAGVAVNVLAHTVYVTNSADNNLSVIDANRCSAGRPSCTGAAPTTPAGNQPGPIAVDQATGTVYAANQASRQVSLIDGRHCSAVARSGCGRTPPTANVGAYPWSITVDPLDHRVFVADLLDNAVSVLNTATCNAERLTCAGPSLVVGNGPHDVAVDDANGTIYVANGLENGLDNDVSLLPLRAACLASHL